MENIFRDLFKRADIPAYMIADELAMSPNTVSRLIAKTGYPDTAQLRTLDRFARYFGYRVKVTLERVNGE